MAAALPQQLQWPRAPNSTPALAALARNSTAMRTGSTLTDLRSLNPAARFMLSRTTGTAYIAVDAVTRGDPQALKTALVKLEARTSRPYT